MDRVDDDAGLASHFASGDHLLREELAALRREVRVLRGQERAASRSRRRSTFDPHPAVSARTIRRRTGIALVAALALLTILAVVAGFALLRAIASVIGDLFAPQLVTASIVHAAAGLIGLT